MTSVYQGADLPGWSSQVLAATRVNSEVMASGREPAARIKRLMAIQWALGWAAAGVTAFAPLLRVNVVVRGARTIRGESLLSEDPVLTLIFIAPSVVSVVVGYAFRRHRIARGLTAVVLWGSVIADILVAGLFFVPAALVASLAALLPNPPAAEPLEVLARDMRA